MMNVNFLVLYATFALPFFCSLSTCLDISFTIDVAPGVRECLHQYMAADTQFEVEYQVVLTNFSYRIALHLRRCVTVTTGKKAVKWRVILIGTELFRYMKVGLYHVIWL